MNLWITEDDMVSEDTAHTAHRVGSGWVLSWLPERVLDRNQAVTGMVLAEMTGAGDLKGGDRRLPLLSGLAAELGLTGLEAAERAARPPVADDLDTDTDSDVSASTPDVPVREAAQGEDVGWVDER